MLKHILNIVKILSPKYIGDKRFEQQNYTSWDGIPTYINLFNEYYLSCFLI